MTSASIGQVFHIPNVDSHRRISSSGFVGPPRSLHEQHINSGALGKQSLPRRNAPTSCASEGDTEVLVSIDCLVFPATDGSAPIFRAVRNGPTKDQSPPGEARIMKSLLGALQKSVEIYS